MSQHQNEIESGQRFGFGANWSRFLKLLDDTRIAQAEESLRTMLGIASLQGKRFLDAGSGSGLFSLAARRMGASVHSFDYDPRSVGCTAELKRRYFPDDSRWNVETGSVLDAEYLVQLGQFDVVYSWGVLHHTGDMHLAMDNIVRTVAPGGALFIALYNDQGWLSKYWSIVKRQYNRGPVARRLIILLHAPYLLIGRSLVRLLSGRIVEARGMSLWYDMIDWLGGLPFEVSRPDDVVGFYERHGFAVQKMHTVGRRQGCNEFVFRRAPER